jgi:thiol-disulfide isomerase/thioredoxin
MTDDPAPPGRPRGIQLNNTIIIGGLLAIAAAIAASELFGAPGLSEGTKAPPLTLTRLDGTQFSLEALEGQVVLLNFWATWCPPCNEEMPELVGIARDFEGKGVVFVAASQDDPPEAKAAVMAWVSHHEDARPYVALAASASSFGVVALPTTFVLDRKGRVVKGKRGRVEGFQVKAWLEAAMDRR